MPPRLVSPPVPVELSTKKREAALAMHQSRPADCGPWAVTDRVERLKQMWAEGYSGTIIAQRLGGGLTRNAVIGKAFRLKLAPRTTSNWQTPRWQSGVKRPRKPRLKPKMNQSSGASALKQAFLAEPYVPPVRPVIPREEWVMFEQLQDHHCRFPVNDAKDKNPDLEQAYCGRAKVTGLPYCADHARICFAPPQARAGRPQPPGPLYRKSVLTGQIAPVHLHELEDV